MFRTLRYCVPNFAIAIALLLARPSFGQMPPAFRNTIDTISPDWNGPVFELSRNYPTTLPAGDAKPWKAFDFKTQPREYIQAIIAYAREGNEAVQWRVQDNATRRWYHAPGLLGAGTDSIPASGREFIHGLTRERTSPKKELHPSQDKPVSNWAVGFYNPIAAFTIGKVWADPESPDTDSVQFEDGAVAFKLLFTSASDSQVPFLANSMKWQANIDLADPPSTTRAPHDVLLLQVDVAVRDDRNDDVTGWVFGTFMYQADASGTDPLDRLVPVGLMWGNDLDQTWLNRDGTPPTESRHVGWRDRLNGPVDNPRSACLSCHARAVVPYLPGNTVPRTDADADDPAKKFFTNTKAGDVYDGAPAGSISLDYSLQLAVGVRLFPGSAPSPAPQALIGRPPAQTFNFRSGEPEEPVTEKADSRAASAAGAPKAAPGPAATQENQIDWVPWGAAGAIVIVLIFIWLRSKPHSGGA